MSIRINFDFFSDSHRERLKTNIFRAEWRCRSFSCDDFYCKFQYLRGIKFESLKIVESIDFRAGAITNARPVPTGLRHTARTYPGVPLLLTAHKERLGQRRHDPLAARKVVHSSIAPGSVPCSRLLLDRGGESGKSSVYK